MRLPRPCKYCNKTFTPEGRYQKLCKECYKKSHTNKKSIAQSKKTRKLTERLKHIGKLKI